MKTIYEKSLGLTPYIQIEKVGGSLQIKGWMRSEVFVSSDDEQVELIEQEGGIRIRTATDCVMRVPRAARLEIGQVAGNLRLKYLDNDLRIDQVGGSVVCRSLGNLTIGTVNGSLMAKDGLGSITCQQVGGSVIARHVLGDLELGKVNGNLDGRHLSASLRATVGGFCRAEWNVFNGREVILKVGGSAHCEISDALQPQLTLRSGAREIHMIQLGEKKHISEETYQFSIGEGLIPFDLQAEGKIVFIMRPPTLEEEEDLETIFNEEVNQITEKVNLQFQTQMDALQQQMDRFSEQMGELTAAAAQREERSSQIHSGSGLTARLQEKMRRAQERMEQKLAEAHRRSEQKAKLSSIERIGFGRKREATSEKDATDILDEERLLILKMLEQKKITVAEAEKLLAALEGNV
ncbi:MAG: hypothetical protein N3D16_09155 [Anaerolineales bacterium]|nr:hypothetical protein [Anaerolineales bacterium]